MPWNLKENIMSKRSEVLVSGCSFTATCEHQYGLWRFKQAGLSTDNFILPRPLFKCWAELVSEKINKPVVNIATSGASNYAICKRAQDYIIENYNKIDFAIIALSGWDRVQDVLHRHYGMMSFPSNDHIMDDLDSKTPKLISSTLRQIYELQLVCKTYDIKCVFFQMLPVLGNNSDTYARKILENPYFNLIEEKYLLGWPFIDIMGGYSFYEKYLKDKKDLQIGDVEILVKDKHSGHQQVAINRNDPHPNHLGHKVIYEKVLEHLDEIKVI